MIKKLQKKFILLSMSAFFAVLSIIIVSIHVVNYDTLVTEADELLSILSDNKGIFPLDGQKPENMEPERKEFPRDLPPHLSPEVPYESRYFTVVLKKDTLDTIQVDTSRIVSVDTSQAVSYGKEAAGQKAENGFVDRFRYLCTTDNDSLRITFLDWGRKIDSFQSFLFTSIIISLLGYAVVFFFIAFFSERIIRPISESYEKQKRFITDAGHEIKTPLAIIYADADVLEMETGENEWTLDIKRQTRRLTDLTNDLVCLARMEESENPLPMMDFPLSDIIEEAAFSFQTLAQSQNRDFQTSIQPFLTLKGNEKSIRQLAGILLDNAFKYSPDGGSIALTLEKQNKSVVLTVSNDTKTIVLPEQLPLLFDRFYRTDPSRSSETGGHGIGLSIAKAIVTAHGGKIQAATEGSHHLKLIISIPI